MQRAILPLRQVGHTSSADSRRGRWRVGPVEWAVDAYGNAPLHIAAARPDGAAAVQQLIAARVALDAPGSFGVSPRLRAVDAGQWHAAALLEAAGAELSVGAYPEPSQRGLLASVFGIGGSSIWRGQGLSLATAVQAGIFAPIAAAFEAFCAASSGGLSVDARVAAVITAALRDAPMQLDRTPEAIAADILRGKAVVLPTGYRGHATTDAFVNPYAVRANRGTRPFAVHRYTQYSLPMRVRASLHLRHCRKPVVVAAWQGLDILYSVPKNDPLRLAMEHKPGFRAQHMPNCAVANAKAAIYALLMLLEQPHAHEIYKSFTTYLRYTTLRDYLNGHPPGGAPADDALVGRCLVKLLTGRRWETWDDAWKDALGAACRRHKGDA